MKTIYESKSNEINNKSNLLTVVSLFFYILLFFAVNDGLRDTFSKNYFPLSFLRDMSIFIGGLFCFFVIRKTPLTKKAIFLLIPLIMICTYSLITTLLVNQNDVYVRNLTTGGGLGFWMKALGTIFCFFIIYIYINNFHLSKVINSYIYFSFFYSLLTITIIFFFPSYYHSLPSRNWYGRLSIGYPTQDVFVLALSLFFLLHSTISKGFKILIFITNVICLMMQNNATGYVLLETVFILTFIKGKMHVKFVSIVFFFVIIVSVYYFYNNYYLFDTFGQLVKLKIDSLIYGTADSSSIDERLLQVTNTMRTIYSDPIYFLVGYGGLGGFAVESGAYSIIGFSGFIGMTIYVFILLYALYYTIRERDFFMFGVIVLYILGSVSISSLYLTSTSWIYAFILAYLSLNARTNIEV